MKTYIAALLILLSFIQIACAQQNKKSQSMDDNHVPEIQKSEEEWKSLLTDEQYYILRKAGTERPFTGEYNEHKAKGNYHCAACDNLLFHHSEKFDSHCGWPSFYDAKEGRITQHEDFTHGMHRIEVRCAKCGGHLGHVFPDGPKPTGLRYCINSISMKFKAVNED